MRFIDLDQAITPRFSEKWWRSMIKQTETLVRQVVGSRYPNQRHNIDDVISYLTSYTLQRCPWDEPGAYVDFYIYKAIILYCNRLTYESERLSAALRSAQISQPLDRLNDIAEDVVVRMSGSEWVDTLSIVDRYIIEQRMAGRTLTEISHSLGKDACYASRRMKEYRQLLLQQLHD